MEDDEAIRLEMEWARPGKQPKEERIRQRYAKMSAKLAEHADPIIEIEELPEGWAAFLHVMPGQLKLVTAFWLSPGGRYFCFFRLHFSRSGNRRPERIVRTLAESFVLHEGDVIPWEFLGVSFRLGKDFWLDESTLEAGRKHMVFHWRLRKFHIWQFSLADIILRKESMAGYCCDFLNGFKGIKSTVFKPDGDKIVTERRKRYPFGYYDEIGRWCFNYAAGCIHQEEKNAIMLCAYNYRKDEDLKKISGVW